MQFTLAPETYPITLPDILPILTEKFGSSMMDSGELLYLAGTLAAYHWERPAILVEIGAFTGRTTAFMAKVLALLGKRAPILSIDPFERAQPDSLTPRGIYLAYMETMRKHKIEHTCLPLVSFSEDAAAVVPNTIGVLVVDGGHHYPIVSKDLALYAPKVLPGGFIFIDDYVQTYPDVLRAVDEYFVPGSGFTILHKSYFCIVQRNPLGAPGVRTPAAVPSGVMERG